MTEGHVVAGAPGELRAQAGVDAILDVGLGSDVADFLLRGLERVETWIQFPVLKHAERCDITDVPHGLDLIKMLAVVDEVEHEVVLHGDVESLHLLCLGATSPAHSALNRVLSLHEGFVLGLDLVNNAWSVDCIAVAIPIDFFELRGGLILVVVVEQSLQLTMGITRAFVRGSRSKSLQPDSSQVAAYMK